MNKGKPEEFHKSVGFNIPIEWFSTAGYHKLDDVRRAKVELYCVGTPIRDQYNCYLVTILDKNNGRIDAKSFKFDDYLTPSKQVAAYNGLHICSYCSWDWYLVKPVTTAPLVDAIERYIEIYR